VSTNNVQYDANNLAEFTTTSTALTAHASISLTPIANTTYLFFWQAMIAVGADDQRVRVALVNTTDGLTITDVTEQLKAAEYVPVSGFGLYTAPAGTQAAHTFQLQFAATVAGQTVKIKESRLLSWDLSTQDFSAANSADQLISTANTSTWSDVLSLTFTPYASGDYLILASCAVGNSTAAGRQSAVRLLDHAGAAHATAVIRPRNTSDRSASYATALRFTALSAAAKTFKLQAATDGSNGQYKYARIIAIRLDRAGSVAWVDSSASYSTAQHTEQTALTLPFTTGAANAPYTVLGSWVATASDTAVEVLSALNGGVDVLPGQFTGVTDRAVAAMFHYAGWGAGTPVNPFVELANANTGSSTNAVMPEAHIGVFLESGGVSTTPIAATLTPEWNVVALVNDTLTAQWNDLANASRTLTGQWNDLASVQAQSYQLWDVLAAVHISPALYWGVLGAVGQTATLEWSESQNVNRNAGLIWGIAGNVLDSATLQWDVLQSVSGLATLEWGVLAIPPTFTPTLLWDVLGSVNQTLTLSWQGAGTTGRTVEFDWAQYQNTGDALFRLTWSLVAEVQRQVEFDWSQLQSATISVTARWAQLQNAQATVSLSWDQLAQALQTVGLEWDALAMTGATLRVEWNVTVSHIDLTLPLILRLPEEPSVLRLGAESPILALPGESPVAG